ETLNDELEMLCWACAQNHPCTAVIERAIGAVLVESPFISFQRAIYQVLHDLRSVADTLSLTERYFDKIEMWTMQNDMVTRWIHFDGATPLVQRISASWKKLKLKEKNVSHTAFIETVLQEHIKAIPTLAPYKNILRERISILYKHLWYHTFTAPEESTYQRFIKWHLADLRSKGHKKKTLLPTLQQRVAKLLPLLPYTQDVVS
ncbi:MAG: hypothetical protein P0S94_04340, partial [Simkaniaceae bacterium]|nr:hypothetical protein [Simkaniaceae bacterium]